MCDMFADLIAQCWSTTPIAGRDVAIQAQDNLYGVKCYICRKVGHRKEERFKQNANHKKTR